MNWSLASTAILVCFVVTSSFKMHSLFRRARVVPTKVAQPFRGQARCCSAQPPNNATWNGKPNFFISTPIYYVNGMPHLGHAYTSTISDIIARYHRKDGSNVFFLTGTDEHGQKVEQSAIKAGLSNLDFSTSVSAKFKELTEALGCSHDDFIRTTEARHKAAVHALWKRLEQNGQIYLGAYEGWYSIRDEAFYSESELVNGKAPTGADVEWVKEESYFFRLSQWTDKLLELYEQSPDFIAPRGRRSEVLSFLNQEGGLKDLSISRTSFSWGIPVPGNPKHVIYVWLDALTNYITALGFPDVDSQMYKQYWPAALHLVGKDILRFHAIFWPAFLMAAGLEPPMRVFAHGWWTRDGEKMSKSVGNVLDPFELVSQYGVDYVRYFLAAEFHLGNDGDFSHEAFRHRINCDLANDLGNLAMRVTTLIDRNCAGIVPTPGELSVNDLAVLQALRDALPAVRGHLHQQGMKHICESINVLAKLGNKYVDTQAPWLLLKSDPEKRLPTVLFVLAELLRHAAILLQPVMPDTCDRLLDQLGVCSAPESRDFASLTLPLVPGGKIAKPSPIFPKLEAPKVVVSDAASPSVKQAKHSFAVLDVLTATQVAARLSEVGDSIRTKKAAKCSKEEMQPLVQELLYLKTRSKLLLDEGKEVQK